MRFVCFIKAKVCFIRNIDLYNKISKLYEVINLEFHIAQHAHIRKSDEALSDEEEKLYVQAQQIWTNISGKRYYYFEKFQHVC